MRLLAGVLLCSFLDLISAGVRWSGELRNLQYSALGPGVMRRLEEAYAIDVSEALGVDLTAVLDLRGQRGRVSLRPAGCPAGDILDAEGNPIVAAGAAAGGENATALENVTTTTFAPLDLLEPALLMMPVHYQSTKLVCQISGEQLLNHPLSRPHILERLNLPSFEKEVVESTRAALGFHAEPLLGKLVLERTAIVESREQDDETTTATRRWFEKWKFPLVAAFFVVAAGLLALVIFTSHPAGESDYQGKLHYEV